MHWAQWRPERHTAAMAAVELFCVDAFDAAAAGTELPAIMQLPAAVPAQQITQDSSSGCLIDEPSSEPLTTYSRPACPADALRMLRTLLPLVLVPRRTARPRLPAKLLSAPAGWPL